MRIRRLSKDIRKHPITSFFSINNSNIYKGGDQKFRIPHRTKKKNYQQSSMALRDNISLALSVPKNSSFNFSQLLIVYQRYTFCLFMLVPFGTICRIVTTIEAKKIQFNISKNQKLLINFKSYRVLQFKINYPIAYQNSTSA